MCIDPFSMFKYMRAVFILLAPDTPTVAAAALPCDALLPVASGGGIRTGKMRHGYYLKNGECTATCARIIVGSRILISSISSGNNTLERKNPTICTGTMAGCRALHCELDGATSHSGVNSIGHMEMLSKIVCWTWSTWHF